MKNVNLTIVSSDILGNKDTKSISLGNIDKPFSYQLVNGKRTIVGPLSLVMLMQAIQTKDEEKLEEIDPSEKLLFSEKYSIKIRLTESKSGNSLDLDEFTLCPNDTAFKDCFCCDTFRLTRLCFVDNVVLPPKRADELFVVKVLIKHLTGNETLDAERKWIVQNVYPISFVENTAL